jgi:hypothetical protein
MGRHQPPTNRSFYLSVAASTLRFALIVALVVGGIVLINQAFPEATGGNGTAVPDDGPPVTESPSPSPTPDESPSPTPSPTVTGTRIAVFNGAGVTGLAAGAQEQLIEDYGYEVAQEATDAPAQVPVTTIFYRTDEDRIEAEYLANDFFRRLDDVRVALLPEDNTDVDRRVQVAIYLGIDYADLVG